MKQVEVERDARGEVLGLKCPGCGKTDIREHDACERWNPIEVQQGTLHVAQLDAHFETVGLICADCLLELDAPKDVYERMVWL